MGEYTQQAYCSSFPEGDWLEKGGAPIKAVGFQLATDEEEQNFYIWFMIPSCTTLSSCPSLILIFRMGYSGHADVSLAPRVRRVEKLSGLKHFPHN